MSSRDPFSAANLESTPAEFTCSRGTREEVNPAAQRLERHPVDPLPPDPNHDPVPRRLSPKQGDFKAHGTSDRCPGCRALVSGGRAQGHTEECRIRVEGELRKTEEGKARFRAAVSRVGDAPTGCAFDLLLAVSNAMPERQRLRRSLPAEDATTTSLPAYSFEPAPPASGVEVPDRVMSEGAS